VYMTAVRFSQTSGTYAEYCLCAKEMVFPLPKHLTFAQGAGIGIPYMTAHRALIKRCKPEKDEKVLIHGASGAVGNALIQFAKKYGLFIVATCGSSEAMAHCKALGADHVLNHKHRGYLNGITETINGPFELVLELMADVNLSRDLQVLARNGTISVVGTRGDARINPVTLMYVEGNIRGSSVFRMAPDEITEEMKAVSQGVQEKWIHPYVGKEFTMEQVKHAHHASINRKLTKGKLVIQITGGQFDGKI